MYSNNNKISTRQLQVLLILNTFGVIITAMPALNAYLPNNMGVFSPITGGILALLSIFLITGVSGFLGEEGFYGGLTKLFGKITAKIITVLFSIKLIVSLSSDIRIFSHAAKEWLLPHTPIWVISVVIILPCLYCAAAGQEARARLGEILIFIVLIPFALAYGTALIALFGSAALPHISFSKGIYINSALSNCFCFTGIELLMPAFAFLKKPYEIRSHAMGAFIISLLAAAAVNAVTITVLGGSLSRSINFPAVTALAYNAGSEAMAALMLSILCLSVVIFSGGCIFYSAELLNCVFNRSSKRIAPAAAAAGFGLSLIPAAQNQFKIFNTFFNYIFGSAFFFVLPLILNIVVRLKKEED